MQEYIVSGVVRDRQGGFYNLLAQRKSYSEAEALRIKLSRNRAVRHVKVQSKKNWELEGMPGQLALFTA